VTTVTRFFKTSCNKYLLCAITFLVCPKFELYAQKFSLGIKGGANITWAHFGDSDDRSEFNSKPTFGYTLGGLIAFPLKNNFTFVAEGAYAVKGRRISFNDNTWENKNKYSFFDMTMLLRKSFHLYIKENLPTKWYINIGPEISYWLAAKGKIHVRDQGPSYTIFFDREADANFHNMYYNNINRWLFGLTVGLGFEAPIKKTQKLSFEFRFISGHTYLGDKNSAYIEILGFKDTSLKQNLKVLQFTTAYTFDFDLKAAKKGKSTKDKIKTKKR
jgi:hypothetical protein